MIVRNYYDEQSLLFDIRRKTGINIFAIALHGGWWRVYIREYDTPRKLKQSVNGWYRVSDILKIL